MWLIHRTRCKKSNLSPWFPSLFSELSFCHSFVVYIFPYLSVSIMKAHLLLLFLQASLPNSLLDTAQMLFHKLLKAFRQKAKLGGMLLDWASLLVFNIPFSQVPRCYSICPSKYFSCFPTSPTTPAPGCCTATSLLSSSSYQNLLGQGLLLQTACCSSLEKKKIVTCFSP